jgi:LssY-like putative type I secretion system component LssY
VRYRPAPIDALAPDAGAATQEHDGIRVSVVVPGDDEVERLFGVSLAKQNIQPVGLVISNHTQDFYWFLPLALDPDYFTPIEAANRARYFFAGSANEQMRKHFLASAIGSYVGPGQRISGFVFTNLSRGLKPVNVDLLGQHRMVAFYFTIPIANVKAEYRQGLADPEKLYAPDQIRDVGEAELRSAIEAMPCCATSEDGRGIEDPLNFVLVGEVDEVLPSLVRTDWHVTEVLRPRSALETFWSYFFSSQYKYAPVSPIYLFGRPQDLALQKARETARQRNHLRIWRTPLRCAGKPVWIGQISRDVGLSFSWKTLVAHEVDPDVDEARNYLVQDMLRSQGLERFAWAKGVGAVSSSEPHHMADGSPFFTDGLRSVLWFGKGPISLSSIQFLPWERLPPR